MSNSQTFVPLRVFPGHIVPGLQSVEIKVPEFVTTRKVLKLVLVELEIQEPPEKYELVEVCVHDDQSAHGPRTNPRPDGEDEDSDDDEKVFEVQTTERVLAFSENPVKVTQSWRRMGSIGNTFRLFLRERQQTGKASNRLTYSWMDCHESLLSRSGGFQFDAYSNVDDDDLCRLPDLNEQTLLEKLFQRFERGKIYTYVGEILIAVNPYKFFPIYNPKYINTYQNKRLGDLQPHIFAIADEAFQNMLKERKNQCVVISGESGSGKTESTKLLLHHLTALSHKSGFENTDVEKTILGAGPVLEAFGNAKTASNNNSSRFGKFTEVKFREDGTVSGAILRKYLLEKSRIVTQAVGERNYHVFYYLLAGANEVEAQEFHLGKPESYSYLNKTGCFDLDGVDEAYEFLRLKQSMDMVGFSSDTQRKIFRVLSAVLWMGNVEFVRKHSYDDAVTLKDKDEDGVVSIISNLLMLKKEKFVSVLTSRKKKTRTEQIVMSYKLEEAVDTRDALAKALYGALFDWIVLQVNHTLAMRYAEKKDMGGNSIGVLDIFGFEVFQLNSFEQFCINYANEKLQFYFNHHIFRMEQDEYKTEGITWDNVNYVDNSSCLDLIHAKPTGLFQLLDEESGLSGNVASDTTLLAKFQRHHASHKSFETSLIEPTFTIMHYAGKVTYDIKDFRAKNKDLMRPEIVSILKNSQMRFIRELLGADPMAIYRWAIVRNYFRAIAAFQKYGKKHRQDNHDRKVRLQGRKEPLKVVAETTVIDEQYMDNRAKMIRKASKMVRKRMKSVTSPEGDIERIRKGLETKKDMSIKTFDYLYRGNSKRKASLKNPPTVTAQFQLSLNRLMEILDESNPFFVRCIRSNAEKAALEFTKDLVLSQLRYTGMLETIRIRKLGYHIRFSYQDFHIHFGLLLPREMKCDQLKDNLRDILRNLGLQEDQFRLGMNKVFFREAAYDILRRKIDDEFLRRVSVLQGWFRALHYRKLFLQKRSAAIVLQERYRERLDVRNKAAIKIQAAWRMHVALQEHRKVKKDEEDLRHFRFSRSKSPSSLTSPKRQGAFKLQLPLDGDAKSKSPRKMERLRKTLSLQISRLPSPKDFGVSTNTENRPKSLSLSPRSPNDRNGEQLGIVKESDGAESCDHSKRNSQSSSDLTSEICRHFPELSDEIRYATVPRSQKEEERRSPRSPRSPTRQVEATTPEEGPGTENEPAVVNGEENAAEDDTDKTPVFENDGGVPPADRAPPVNTRLSRRRTGSLKSIRKRLSVQRRSTIGLGDNRNFADEPEDPPIEAKDKEDELEKDKDMKGSVSNKKKRERPFFKRKPKDKIGRRISEPVGPTEKSEYKPVKRHSEDRLLHGDKLALDLEIESPRGARQLKGDASVVLEGSDGLEEIDKFLGDKIHEMDKETVVDKVFKKAVQEFHSSLISTYSVMMKQHDTSFITSEDLIRNFENILINIIKVDKIQAHFPVAIGINAFEGLLNEFKSSRSQSGPKVPKNKRKPVTKHKKKKHQDIIEYGDHSYALTTFNIYTFCEHCNSMLWILEKGLVCQDCKFTCHKRCYKKSKNQCKAKAGRKKSIANASIFGNDLCLLVSDDIQIPIVVARLINEIENKGLFQEGIYRKSPSAVKVKQLKNSFSTAKDLTQVDLGMYAIHVVAGVLKLFFRTLPSPIITEDVYDEFLRACDLSDSESRLLRFHTLVDTLPKANQDTLERLVFHLARVAKYESSNLMSPSGLSVIWAPCLMRPRAGGSALDGLYDIRKQSMVVESLITGQMAKMDATLADISKIDQTVKNVNAKLARLSRDKDADDELTVSEGQQRKVLNDQLERLEKQKVMLTANLSTLTPHSSLVFEEDNSTDSDNGTSDEIDGEKKEALDKSVEGDTKEKVATTASQKPAPTEQPSSIPLNTKEKRPSKKHTNSLTKQYMDSSDSQDSLDSVT